MVKNYQSEKLVLYSNGVQTGKTLLTKYPPWLKEIILIYSEEADKIYHYYYISSSNQSTVIKLYIFILILSYLGFSFLTWTFIYNDFYGYERY